MAATLVPQVSSVVEYRVFTQFQNQGGVNVRHLFVASLQGSGATLQQIADKLSTDLAPLYKPMMSNTSTYRGVGTRVIWPAPASSEALSGSASGAGTVLPQALGNQVCGLLSLRTNVGGRKGRGRMYIPFPGTPDSLDALTPAAGYLAKLANLGTYVIAPITFGAAPNTLACTPCLFNRKTFTVTFLSNFRTPAKWATQRRRGGFGRPNESPV